MKIKKIEIFNYGKLSHVTLDFNQFQVIYGKNEAGKTTIINFIKDILFGFEHRSTTHLYGPKDKSEMGGKLVIVNHGVTFEIQRVDGKNGGDLTIFDYQGNELSQQTLKEILGPINRNVYDKLFYFGSLDLDAIAKMTNDELEERIRRVGVVGIEQWLKLKKDLDEEAGSIYRPTGKKQRLYMELKNYEKLQDEFKEAKNKYPEFVELTEQLNKLDSEIKKDNQDYNQLVQTYSKVYEDSQNWNKYDQLSQLKNKNLKVKDGFEDHDLAKINDLNNKSKLMADDLNNNNLKIQNLKKQHFVTQPHYQFYLDNQAKINDLYVHLDHQIEKQREYDSLLHDIKNEELRLHQDNIDAGGTDSKPFDSEMLKHVDELIHYKNDLKSQITFAKQNSRSKSEVSITNNQLPIGIMGLGLVIIIIGFLFQGVMLPILLVVGLLLILGGFLLTRKPKQNHTNPNNQISVDELNSQIQNIENELMSIGKKYEIQSISQNQWTNVLQTAIKRRNNELEEINALKNDAQNKLVSLKNYLDNWSFAFNELELTDVSDGMKYNTIKQFVLGAKDQEQKSTQYHQRLQELENDRDQHQKQLDEIQNEMQQFYISRGAKDLAEFKSLFAEQNKLKKQLEQLASLQSELDDSVIMRLKNYPNKQVLDDKLQMLKDQQEQLKLKMVSLTQKQTAVKIKIDQLKKDGTFLDLKQKLATSQSEINDLTSKWLVYKLTNEWIERVLNQASHGRFPQVQQQAQKYFDILTDHHYIEIKYGKKIEVVSNDGMKFKIKELSRGTMQQLYLSLIFALTISFSDEFPMPIIIDDGFVEFDHVRTNNAIELMKLISETTQILYFTADDRIMNEISTDLVLKLD
ncbi:ATP-binding protein [Fructilactobacillus lindneri]|uniref:YhaN AAA domain-containing protein n=1 Tax=Fructilactobacillus lindneri DSM 20690 = JCM 11027 TaxID=1122148 RepID=A0A0R2JWY7_9LACO|nr:AAA family ATPase [Fructilactobacillus lindneri]KRN79114.1 hypothetical protein IV52_GL000519 [Fructilactobacillus lindneri DSM 20690 = JCM 11027]SJZ75098.1 Uncharacterized protein YhaN [Fructilactobacillus lindneri DSM 20690 = JCM 11027]